MQPAIEFQNHPMVRHADHAMGDQEPQRIVFPAVLGAIRRRKKLIATIFVTIITLVVGILLVLPARYTATTLIEVASGDANNLIANPVSKGLSEWIPGDNSVMATQIATIKTRALATQVTDNLKLGDDPNFHSWSRRAEENVTVLMQRWFPLEWQKFIPWNVDISPATRREEAAQHLLQQLAVAQEGTSHVISVSFTSPDPEKAAAIANAVATQYLDNQIAAKHRSTERAYHWATAQLLEQHQKLLEAETAAIDYMTAHGLEASNGLSQPAQPPPYRSNIGGLPIQQLTNLQDELGAARSHLAAYQAKVNEIDALKAKGSGYDSLHEVSSSPTIATLRDLDAKLSVLEAQLGSTYNASTPVLDRIRAQRRIVAQKIATESQKIVDGIRGEESVARGRIVLLELLMSKGQSQYATTERASVGLRELNRDANAKRAQYEKLLAKKNEIGQQLALIEPDGTIISTAIVPRQPSFPNKILLGFSGFVGALVSGIVLAGLAEYSDHSFRTGRQVEQTLATNNLGMVPLLTHREHPAVEQPYTTISRQPLSMYSEAIRSVLLQLIANRSDQAQVVLVTSALPGEGKTTMTMSLAAAAARLGRRTVVLDLDLRHPSVAFHAGLALKENLLSYMDGSAALDQIIYPDPQDPRLHLIPAKISEGRVAQELHRCNMIGLIGELRAQYECIFVDLPPTLALSDIQAVGGMADSALLVVQWGKTSRSAAIDAMSAIVRIGVPVAGVVLTQVDITDYETYGYDQISKYYSKYLGAGR